MEVGDLGRPGANVARHADQGFEPEEENATTLNLVMGDLLVLEALEKTSRVMMKPAPWVSS